MHDHQTGPHSTVTAALKEQSQREHTLRLDVVAALLPTLHARVEGLERQVATVVRAPAALPKPPDPPPSTTSVRVVNAFRWFSARVAALVRAVVRQCRSRL